MKAAVVRECVTLDVPGGGDVPAVLLVAENGSSGGIGRYCVDTAALLGRRAKVLCLCPVLCECSGGADESNTCWLAKRCRARNVALDAVSMPSKHWSDGAKGLQIVWRRAGRPILHVNGRRGNSIALVLRSVVPGLRYVTTVHGILGLHDLRNLVYRRVDLAACRAAKQVIAVSMDTYRKLAHAGLAPSKLSYIPNGLADSDLAALVAISERRGSDSRAREGAVMGFVGRLSPEKGVAQFARAARALQDVDQAGRWVVVGDGPLAAALRDEYRDLLNTGYLSLVGEIDDVERFLGDIDVLVMPSANEGLPYALLEAMAAGCAVVAYGVGGIPEAVLDSSLGCLVRPDDPAGLVDGVRQLVRSPEAVARIGAAASVHARSRFRLSTRLDAVLGTYGFPTAESDRAC